MTLETGRLRLDQKTLLRVLGTGAVAFGMAQVGGDTPHAYSPETFSNRPSLTQTVDAAPWLGRNRMQDTSQVRSGLDRPAPRPIHVEPWQVAAGTVGAGFVGWEVFAASEIAKGIKNKNPRQWQRGGLIAVSPALLFCGIGPEIQQLATKTPEVAAEVRFLDVNEAQASQALKAWMENGTTLPDGGVIQGDKPVYAAANVQSPDGKDVGKVMLAVTGSTVNGTPEYQTFLIWNDGLTVSALATGNARASADGKSVISDLVDVSKNVRAQQETGLDLRNPSIKLVVNNVTYALQPADQTQLNDYLTNVKLNPGTNGGQVAPTVESSTPTAVPTEAATLSLDATKQPGEWDLSRFTAEQQAWINQAMTDPDHASPEAKQFYNEMRVEGIREQTGDASYTVEDATGAQVGKYSEWLFANGIHETAPLPFTWRKANLENPDNLVGFNYNAQRGYTIEGYDGFGTLADETKTSGYGENEQPFPSHDTLLLAKDYRIAKGNAERDTIFGEPSMIILPRGSNLRGDLMVLSDIAGVSPDVAQEGVIRMYDEVSGTARYTVVRLQYQDETVKPGDNSCETIPGAQSIVCAPGTTIPHAIMSTWSDWQLYARKHAVTASRENMISLFGQFQHPPMIMVGPLFGDEQFVDGAIAVQDIRVPEVPEGVLK